MLLLAVLSFTAFAQDKKQVTIKAGTIVPLEAVEEIRGATANEGQTVDFRVRTDIKVNGIVAIPAGTIAKGTVYEAKRSTAFGTRGRLGIKLNRLTTESGDIVLFTDSKVYIKGANRTPLSVIIFLCTCLPFPCGGKAVMPIGYELEAVVASNTDITL